MGPHWEYRRGIACLWHREGNFQPTDAVSAAFGFGVVRVYIGGQVTLLVQKPPALQILVAVDPP
jgi:hypothetical protein